MNRAARRRLARANGNAKPIAFEYPSLGRFTVTPAQLARALDLNDAATNPAPSAPCSATAPIRASSLRAPLTRRLSTSRSRSLPACWSPCPSTPAPIAVASETEPPMPDPAFKLDHAGITSYLCTSPELAAGVRAAAQAIADGYNPPPVSDGGPIPVKVKVGVSGRKSPRITAGITAEHPAAVPIEAKYGPLAQAAHRAGFELNKRRA